MKKASRSAAALEATAFKIVGESLKVRKGEKVALLSDGAPECRQIVAAFSKAIEKIGAQTLLTKISLKRLHSSPVPGAAKAMLSCDVVIAPTRNSVTHSPESTAARKAGKRGITLPGINEEIFLKIGTADFAEVRRLNTRIVNALKKAKKVRITTPTGTDVELRLLPGREVVDNGPDAFVKGARGISNMPFGEAFVAPDENGMNGVVVIDSWGKIIPGKAKQKRGQKERAALVIRNGRIVAATGKAKQYLAYLDKAGSSGRVIAELGIGTNYAHKKPIGNILHDEKIGGSVHVAFGQNTSFGGTNSCGVHEDVILLQPKMWIDGKLFTW